MDELTPCPFCGDTFIRTEEAEAHFQLWTETRYRIGCNTCNCFGCRSYSRKFKTEEEAKAAWNKRSLEIVRCEDCSCWLKLLLNQDGDGVCRIDGRVRSPDWFCPKGIRREDNGNE